jgi:hypothetical protein
MSHVDSVRELASILNPRNEARPTILLGAGASFSSGVPLADESVKRMAAIELWPNLGDGGLRKAAYRGG